MHFFDVDLAAVYGVNAAVILENIYYWCRHNQANERNFFDGRYWTYNSGKAFAELFPYMSQRQAMTAIQKLIDEGIIVKGNYNTSTYDRTSWYALTEMGESIMQKCKMDTAEMSNGNSRNVESIMQKCKMETSKMSNGNVENVEPIPINKHINKHINKTVNKHKYGEYNNVLLSDEELEKLQNEFTDWQERIERLSGYMKSKGKVYKDHLATIRNWARREKEKPQDRTSIVDSWV